MISRKNEAFRLAFRRLPKPVQEQARRAFRIFQRNPYHRSLRFKRVHSREEVYSVRVGADHRALACRENGPLVWFWIGSHSDYGKLI
jgi:hypothetical protein